MLKYVTIPDIRRYPSYNNINARLLYLHVALSMDIASRTYAHSWRQLSQELGMPLQQLRTALAQLEKDGLIATQQVTQEVTYGVTQRVTHKVTQIYILSVSDLDEATNEATNSPTNSPTNSQSNSDKNNINNPNSRKAPLTDTRVTWTGMGEKLASVLHLDIQQGEQLVADFRERQRLKKKSWIDEGDLLAHLVSWSEKHLSMVKKSASTGTRTDSQARQEEYARAKEAEAAKTEQEKDFEELEKVKRWYNQRLAEGDEEAAEEMRKAWIDLRDRYEEKYARAAG